MALINHSMGFATHSISTGCFEGGLNAYLAFTMTCGGQLMDKLAFHPS